MVYTKMYVLITAADTNDGDEITQKIILEYKYIQTLKDIVSKLPRYPKSKYIPWENGQRGNTGEELIKKGVLTEEEVDFFNEITPYGEFGIHTIISIDILKVIEEEFLLK